MHTFVVIGDVITHRIQIPGETLSVHGGARLCLDAIKAALPDVASNFDKNFPPFYGVDKQGEGEIRCWMLSDHVKLDSERDRYDLKSLDAPAKNGTQPTFVPLPQRFEKGLQANWWQQAKEEELVRNLCKVPTCPDIVVVIDSGVKKGKLSKKQTQLVDALATATKQAAKLKLPIMEPVILYYATNCLREIVADEKRLFNQLRNQNNDLPGHTVVIVDADDLRDEGLAISSGLSWERTAQDTILAIRRHETLRRLLNFSHLIIRYSDTGALHIVGGEKAIGKAEADENDSLPESSFYLHYIAEVDDKGETGLSIGGQAGFVAALVRQLYDNCKASGEHPFSNQLFPGLKAGIKKAIHVSARLRETGVVVDSGSFPDEEYFHKKIFRNAFSVVFDEHEEENSYTKSYLMGYCSVPPVQLSTWSILSQMAQHDLHEIAKEIVRCGVKEALKNKHIVPPIVYMGQEPKPGELDDRTVLIDRRDIEGYRSLQKLIESHCTSVFKQNEENDKKEHDKKERSRPLSIAVFGPPGSGKSSAVKSIVKNLSSIRGKRPHILSPFNLSQYTNPQELENNFDQISRSIKDNPIPVAFFDEFDSRLKDPYDWLKMFLGPMEEGAYKKDNFNSAILVFAGGTSSSFADFSMENRPKTDERYVEFAKAKGPDFVSRLKGYLNVVGVNPSDQNDELYLIRRAITIRSMLEAKEAQRLTDGMKAKYDPSLLYALLHVPEYRHHTRSLRTLIHSCLEGVDRKLSAASIPPVHQLNMLVDAKAFQELLRNSGSR